MADVFTETLLRFISDPAILEKNKSLDADLLKYYQDRIQELTPDQVKWFSSADVVSTGDDAPTGALAANVNTNSIDLNVAGFEFRTSKFRDGLQATPRKIRRRSPGDLLVPTPADRVRYVMADPTDGVLLLDQNLEIVRTFPGLTGDALISGALYRDAEAASIATLSVAATEVLAVACGVQHVVQLYNYTTGALLATIGTPGAAGLPDAGDLTDPVSVAIDALNERLFIACRTGAGTGGDGTPNGFVCEFDISNPAAPAFVNYTLVANGLYRLNNTECFQPSDLFLQPAVGAQMARLWVSNGFGDVAAFERPDLVTAFSPVLVIEAQGDGFVLGPDNLTVSGNEYSENAIDVISVDDGTGTSTNMTRLHVATSRTGPVEVFRADSSHPTVPLGTHEATFGQRGIETTSPYGRNLRVHSCIPQPPLTFGVFSGSAGVVADQVTLPGESVASDVLVVADAAAGRVQRLRTEVYENKNSVTFETVIATIPTSIIGWFLPGDASFDADNLVLEIRDPGDATTVPVQPATEWRQVPKLGFAVNQEGPEMLRYQLRLRTTLPSDAPIEAFTTSAIGVLLRQVW